MRHRWGEYLVQLQDEAYRDYVFGYVDNEDTPQPLIYQINLMRQAGL